MLALRFVAAAALPLYILSPAGAQPAATQLTVTVWSFGFAPHPLHLRAGQPVTLTFVNRSGSSHDFSARGFFANSRILNGSAEDGEIDLPGRAVRSVTVVPRAGSYSAHCSHFMHKQMGMQDSILVD